MAPIDSIPQLCSVLGELEEQIKGNYANWSQLVDWVICVRFNQVIAAGQELTTPGLLPLPIEENDQPSVGGMLVILQQTLGSLGCPQPERLSLASPGFFD